MMSLKTKLKANKLANNVINNKDDNDINSSMNNKDNDYTNTNNNNNNNNLLNNNNIINSSSKVLSLSSISTELIEFENLLNNNINNMNTSIENNRKKNPSKANKDKISNDKTSYNKTNKDQTNYNKSSMIISSNGNIKSKFSYLNNNKKFINKNLFNLSNDITKNNLNVFNLSKSYRSSSLNSLDLSKKQVINNILNNNFNNLSNSNDIINIDTESKINTFLAKVSTPTARRTSIILERDRLNTVEDDDFKVKINPASIQLVYQKRIKLLTEAFNDCLIANKVLLKSGLLEALQSLNWFYPKTDKNELNKKESELLNDLYSWLSEENVGAISLETFTSHLIYAYEPSLLNEAPIFINRELILSLADHILSVPIKLPSTPKSRSCSIVSLPESCTFTPYVSDASKKIDSDRISRDLETISQTLEKNSRRGSVNRFEMLLEKRKDETISEENGSSFKPFVSEISKKLDAERLAKLPVPDERRKSRHDLLISLGPIRDKQLEELRKKQLEEENSLLSFTPNTHRLSQPNIKKYSDQVYERLLKDAETRQINTSEIEQQMNNLNTPKNDPNFSGGRPSEFFKLDSSLLKINTSTDLTFSNYPAMSPVHKAVPMQPVVTNSYIVSELVTKSREIQKSTKELEECTFRPLITPMKRGQSARKEIRGESTSVLRSRSAQREREKIINFWDDRNKQMSAAYDERMKKERVMGRSASAQPLKRYQAPLMRDIRQETTDEPKSTSNSASFKRITSSRSRKSDLNVPVEVINIKEKSKVILLVDVNLSHNKSARINVHENDTPENLAREFVRIHGLNEKLYDKLLLLLRQKINNYLDLIKRNEIIEVIVPAVKNNLNKDLTRKSFDSSLVLKERVLNMLTFEPKNDLKINQTKFNEETISSIEPSLQEIAEKYNLNFSEDDSKSSFLLPHSVSIVSSKGNSRSTASSKERPKNSSHQTANLNVSRTVSSRSKSTISNDKIANRLSNNGPTNYAKLFRIPFST